MTFTKAGGAAPFFQAYEQALESADPAWIAEIYHTSFLFGGPGGAQTVKLDDFLNFVPKRAAFAKSLGLTSTRLVSVDETALDEVYTLARVTWKVTIKKHEETRDLLAQASYLLLQKEDSYRIAAQIDHQDLMAQIQQL